MIVTSIDDFKIKPKRIVSLVPSQTELLFYLGLDKSTVGITKFCVHPKEWQSTKTIIGGTKNISIEKIKALQPDLIIASKEENVQEQVEGLAADYTVWVTDVKNLNDALQMISDIGSLTGTLAAAEILTKNIKRNFGLVKILEQPMNTCYLIWRKPYMTAGGDTFINDMLAKCGLQNMYAAAKRYPEINLPELQLAHCQLLLLSSEPYPFQQKHIDEIQTQLPHTKIVLADGEMFSWYGSRLLEVPTYFAKLIEEIKNL